MGDSLVAQNQVELRGAGARHHELADPPLHPALYAGVLLGGLGADPLELGSKQLPASRMAPGEARKQERVFDLLMEAQAPVIEPGEGKQMAHDPRHRARREVDRKHRASLEGGDSPLAGPREDVAGEGALPAPRSAGELDDHPAP
jgi:hypothetical protein